MEWYFLAIIFFGALLILLFMGTPVAFAFMLVSLTMVFFLWHGEVGMMQIIVNIKTHMAKFVWMPLVLFIMMGTVIFHAGLAPQMISAIDNWLGRLPGRLGLLAVASGTLLATLTGSSMASTAVLGSMLTPEMEKRGYKKPMSLGPILGSGGLAMMIPPSGLAVFAAVIAEASIGKILMGIIIPGLMMASLYAAYTILRCRFQPSIAPAYDITPPPLKIKLLDTARYILPVSIIIFLVIGVILLGIATPSEAAATGAVGCFLLAATYGKLTWKAMKSSLISTTQIATMVLIVAVGAIIYSQMLTFTGLGREVAAWITSLDVQPIIVIIFIQVLGVMIGMFMIALAVLTIILPVFLPIIAGLGFDPIWFVVIMLLNTEMAQTSPPYGSGLIIMRGVAPRDTTMGHIYKAALPYLGCDVIVLAIMIAFPKVVLWLPSLTR